MGEEGWEGEAVRGYEVSEELEGDREMKDRFENDCEDGSSTLVISLGMLWSF